MIRIDFNIPSTLDYKQIAEIAEAQQALYEKIMKMCDEQKKRLGHGPNYSRDKLTCCSLDDVSENMRDAYEMLQAIYDDEIHTHRNHA